MPKYASVPGCDPQLPAPESLRPGEVAVTKSDLPGNPGSTELGSREPGFEEVYQGYPVISYVWETLCLKEYRNDK